jgi:hypothetical protein
MVVVKEDGGFVVFRNYCVSCFRNQASLDAEPSVQVICMSSGGAISFLVILNCLIKLD